MGEFVIKTSAEHIQLIIKNKSDTLESKLFSSECKYIFLFK